MWQVLINSMTGPEKLQFIGLLATSVSVVFAGLSWWLWVVLPQEKKVWGVALWIFYCGALAILADYIRS